MNLTCTGQLKSYVMRHLRKVKRPDLQLTHPHSGKYYDQTGAASAEDCLNCTAGFYCNSGTVTPTLPCAPGYFCPGGSSSPEHLKCPKGHRCGAGTGVPEPCPEKMYQPEEGMSQCYFCTESHYCPLKSVEMRDCLPYSYCPHGKFLCLVFLQLWGGANPIPI